MIYIDKNRAINFAHRVVPNAEADAGSRITECAIVDVTGDITLGYGQSRCHPRDNFNKEFGRKTALARAIRGMTRPERTEIWNAYFNR